MPLNWSSLVVVLKGEGIYSELCTNSTALIEGNAINTNGTQPPTVRFQKETKSCFYSQTDHFPSFNMGSPQNYYNSIGICVCSQCAAQDLRLNLVYSVGLLLSYAFIAVQGFIMDWRGPRLIFMVGAILYFLGTVAFSLAYPGGSFDGVFVGQVLLSVGAPPIFTALMWFSTLFPDKMPTVSFEKIYTVELGFDSTFRFVFPNHSLFLPDQRVAQHYL